MMAATLTQVPNLISEILHVLVKLYDIYSVARGLMQYTRLKHIGVWLNNMQLAIFNHFLLTKAKISCFNVINS